jgi:uncharacterized protein
MTIVVEDEVIEFDWDEGNLDKNWVKHQTSAQEAEEAFADENKIIFLDIKHLGTKKRYFLLAQTTQNRLLAIAYTQRDTKVRVISARDASRKEKVYYEEATRGAQIQE